MRKLLFVLATLAILAISINIQGQPEEVELILEQGLNDYEGTRDTSIYAERVNSNGAGDHIFSGNAGGRNPRRALIAFDLSDIPEGATINSVSLQLTVSRTITAASDQSLHRLTADWGEGTVHALGQEGQGSAAEDGDATWVSNFHNESIWETPGGDLVEEASATAEVGGVRTTPLWEGDGLVADVQQWIDGEAENYGWVLIGNEAAFTSAKRFNSANNPNVDEGAKPRLVIRYTPAE